MKTKNIILIIFAVALIGALLDKAIEYYVGAYNELIGCLIAIPFLFVWCLVTDAKLTDKLNKSKGYVEL